MTNPSIDRLDPDMRAFLAEQEAEAAQYPPIRLEVPLDPHRLVNDALACGRPPAGRRWRTAGIAGSQRGDGAFSAGSTARGTDEPLPVLVYFHGGGWVWASVDTHDRLVRDYAAGAEIATVNVDYALSPEAKFPQAVEECAAVVRHIAAHGAEWGLDGSRILLGGDSAAATWRSPLPCCCATPAVRRCAAILAFYPVCDSRLDTPSYREFGTGYGLTRERMAFYWNVYVPHAADRVIPWPRRCAPT